MSFSLRHLRGAARALRARRQQLFGGMRVPGVRAFLLKPFHHVAQRREIVELLSAGIAEEHDDRNAPETLARNAPVRTVLDHFVDALFAPAGNPLHVVNFRQRFLAQGFLRAVRHLIQLDEPLLRGAENHRIVATPAVRIAVLVRVMAKQRAAIAQQFHDDGICREHVLAFVFRQAFQIHAAVVERRVGFQAVFLAGDEVVRAVAGRGVHDPAALIERDVIGQHPRHLNRQKRMLKFHALKIPSLECGQHVGLLDRPQSRLQRRRRDPPPAATCLSPFAPRRTQ